ncbi:MAG TPA: substrate-binding domain-containing protein [Trueperaceae bacterium]
MGAVGRIGAALLAFYSLAYVSAQDLRVGGSSTLYPASAEFAAQLSEALPAGHIEASFAGTGGGFELFCKGAIEIVGASRLATDDEERACRENGVEYLVFPVALDAVVLVVPEDNEWVECLTVAEVRRLWSGGPEQVETWSDLRSEWPDQEIAFYAPGVASGTYDYWKRKVLGSDTTMRTDYFPSEDDRRLAQLTASHPAAVSFFGRPQLELAGSGLRAVPIDNGDGCVDPDSTGSVLTRWPFLRPLFLYVAAGAAGADSEVLRPLVSFVDTFLSEAGQERLLDMGYLQLGDRLRGDSARRFATRVTGPLDADYDGQAILRQLPGGWSSRQVDLDTRLLALQREIESVGVVHGRLDTLFEGLVEGGGSGDYDPAQ